MPETYYRDNSFDPFYKSIIPKFYFKSKLMTRALVVLSLVILVTQVIVPLVFFKTQDSAPKHIEASLLGVASGFKNFEFNELNQEPPNNNNNQNIPEYFYLSIPKLRIKDALIETNSTNLSPEDSLGHYKGSSLPGNKGNAFIYGHSVLSMFFNPRNYKTIFSTLGRLKEGDIIEIKYNNQTLVYKVESQDLKIPEKVNPLENIKPEYLNESTITLMTCWPAGTKIKRLMVNATLIQ